MEVHRTGICLNRKAGLLHYEGHTERNLTCFVWSGCLRWPMIVESKSTTKLSVLRAQCNERIQFILVWWKTLLHDSNI